MHVLWNSRIAAIVAIALLLVALPMIGACSTEKVVEVPVEKIVEKEVVKEVPVEKVVIKEVPVEKWPDAISIGGSPMGGLWYIEATAFGKLIEKYVEVTATPEASGGGTANISLMKKGEMEMGMVTGHQLYDAVRGSGLYDDEGRQQLRLLWPTHKAPMPHAVRADSDINTIADLQGKKYAALSPAALTLQAWNLGILEAYGLTEDDIDARTMTTGRDLLTAFKEGTLDVFCYPSGVSAPNSLWLELTKDVDCRLLSIGEEEMGNIRENYPWIVTHTYEAGFHRLQEDPVLTGGFQSYLVCRADLPDGFIYEITKAVWDNYAEIEGTHVAFTEFDVADGLNKPFAPFHPGVIKYFEEKGLWTEELAATQSSIFKNITAGQ